MLINNGAAINVQDNKGNTPLHRVPKGTTITKLRSIYLMPLFNMFTDHKEIADLLIENGANTRAVNDYGEEALHHLLIQWRS